MHLSVVVIRHCQLKMALCPGMGTRRFCWALMGVIARIADRTPADCFGQTGYRERARPRFHRPGIPLDTHLGTIP